MRKRIEEKKTVKSEVEIKLDTLQEAYNFLYKVKFVKGTDKEDLLNTAYVKLADRLDEFEPTAHGYIGLLNSFYRSESMHFARNEQRYSLLSLEGISADNEEMTDSDINSGISNTFINDIIFEVQKSLEGVLLDTFKWYHLEGRSCKEIGTKLNKTKMQVSRYVKQVNDVIDSLEIRHFVDSRYAIYQGGYGKKKGHIASHEREARQKEIYKEDMIPSDVKQLNPETFQESKHFEPETIPSNKCLAYPTKQWIKYTKNEYNDFGIGIGEKVFWVSSLAEQLEYFSPQSL